MITLKMKTTAGFLKHVGSHVTLLSFEFCIMAWCVQFALKHFQIGIFTVYLLLYSSVQFLNGQAKELPREDSSITHHHRHLRPRHVSLQYLQQLYQFSADTENIAAFKLWNTPSRFHQTNTHAFRHNLKRVSVLLTKKLTDWWQNEMIVGLK